MIKRSRTTRLSALIFLLLIGSQPMAQTADDGNVVNYAYAVVFGTGAYHVKDQTAFVFNLPFAYSLREPSEERPGLKLLLPALVGYYNYDYDKVFGGDLPGDAATFSFVPGVELEYVMTDRWRLKPYAQLGLGRDLKNNENALIYVGGVKSVYEIPYESSFRFALGNMATYAGFDPDDGSVQSLSVLGVGLDAIYPWGLSLFGKETNLANYVAYYWYVNNPGFEQGDANTESINGEAEIGLALGFERPPELLGFEFERIGLGFRYGGDITGIRLVTEFPF